MQTPWRFLCALAAASALALPVAAKPPAVPINSPSVTVTRLAYHRWPGALRLSNGLVEAIVVPQIGRIMAFQFVGHPETSPIFENKDWRGKTVADADPLTWATFGGDKLWPSPQSEWAKHNARAWPPDQAFDGDPENAQILPNGIRLVTPSSTAYAARATRTITLRPGQTSLYIAQTLDKDADAVDTRDGFPVGIWTVTQTRGDGTVFLPLSASGKFPAGFTSLSGPGTTETPPLFTPGGGLLKIRRDVKVPHKVGTDSSHTWIASLYSGRILFSEREPYLPGALYPDGGLPVEAYTNGGATAYIELELLGPLVPLMHGKRLAHNITWHLQRLPRAPKDSADARALVTAAMR